MKILFVTNSIFSKSLRYCRACIQKFFPDHPHLIFEVNTFLPSGSGKEHFWYYNLHYLYNIDLYKKYDFVIQIDEDAFVLDRDSIIKILNKLQNDDKAVLAAPSNGLISAYPFAANSYFFAIDVNKFLSMYDDFKDWPRHDSYDDKKAREIYGRWNNKTLQKNLLNAKGGGCEPYHDFCWKIFESGYEIIYLDQVTLSPLPIDKNTITGDGSTYLYSRETKKRYLQHMWFNMTYGGMKMQAIHGAVARSGRLDDQDKHVLRYEKVFKKLDKLL